MWNIDGKRFLATRDVIVPGETIPRMFWNAVQARGERVIFRQKAFGLWQSLSWRELGEITREVGMGLIELGLEPGERVSILGNNQQEWLISDLGVLCAGGVSSGIYPTDAASQVEYLLRDSDSVYLFVEDEEQLDKALEVRGSLPRLRKIIVWDMEGLRDLDDEQVISLKRLRETGRERSVRLGPAAAAAEWQARIDVRQANELAILIYTSGTTGRPKGVMLSHRNILSNAYAGVPYTLPGDLFLSFLPLSHMLERTLGYYIPMMTGATVAFARSVPQLSEDLVTIRPTLLISVPRIYERVYARIQEQLATKSPLARKLFDQAVNVGWERFLMQQGRAPWTPKLLLWPLLNRLVARKVLNKLGGRLRVAIAGGAALAPHIAKTFIGLGLPLIQGYGLTETSPIISGNKLDDNIPDSVGEPLHGVQVRVAENGELLAKGDGVMLGYWNCPEATQRIIDADGWLHTGDKARIESNHIFITGRLKEIIVLANGEKVAPGDMELAIAADPLFEHVMVVGEGRPFLAALVSLQTDQWQKLAVSLGVNPADRHVLDSKPVTDELLCRITLRTGAFPGYAQIRRVVVTPEPWNIDNGLITPTLKLRRDRIVAHFPAQVQQLYAGH